MSTTLTETPEARVQLLASCQNMSILSAGRLVDIAAPDAVPKLISI